MNMVYWSIFNKKKNAPYPVKSGDNLNRLEVARKKADCKVSSLGSIWGEWEEGCYRGILLFNITQHQSGKPLLQYSKVNLSFDCHPRHKECHKAGKSGCNRTQDEPRYYRGTVTHCLPTRLEGELSEVNAHKRDEIEVDPNVSVPLVGKVRFGAFKRSNSTTRPLRDRWVFKSSINPPRYYKEFHERTDVRYDWNGNSLNSLKISDSPSEFQLAVIVDFTGQHVCNFRLLMTLTIDLVPKSPYWSESGTTEHCFDVQNTPENLSPALKMIEKRLLEKDSLSDKPFRFITFRVHDTSQDDIAIKLVGTGGPLGGWEPSKAIVLNRNLRDTTQWHLTVLAEVGSTLEYKFIKVLVDGSGFSWQRGNDDNHTVSPISGDLGLKSPEWGSLERLY